MTGLGAEVRESYSATPEMGFLWVRGVSRTKSAALRLRYVVSPKVMLEQGYLFIPSANCEVQA